MSLRVDLSELETAIADHDYAYFLSVDDEGRAHSVAVTPSLSDGALLLGGLGRRSLANATARTNISLVFPPREVGGYSLIVDGDAAVDGEWVAITPTGAVHHRPAPPAGEAPSGSCGSDCLPIDVGTPSA